MHDLELHNFIFLQLGETDYMLEQLRYLTTFQTQHLCQQTQQLGSVIEQLQNTHLPPV